MLNVYLSRVQDHARQRTRLTLPFSPILPAHCSCIPCLLPRVFCLLHPASSCRHWYQPELHWMWKTTKAGRR